QSLDRFQDGIQSPLVDADRRLCTTGLDRQRDLAVAPPKRRRRMLTDKGFERLEALRQTHAKVQPLAIHGAEFPMPSKIVVRAIRPAEAGHDDQPHDPGVPVPVRALANYCPGTGGLATGIGTSSGKSREARCGGAFSEAVS